MWGGKWGGEEKPRTVPSSPDPMKTEIKLFKIKAIVNGQDQCSEFDPPSLYTLLSRGRTGATGSKAMCSAPAQRCSSTKPGRADPLVATSTCGGRTKDPPVTPANWPPSPKSSTGKLNRVPLLLTAWRVQGSAIIYVQTGQGIDEGQGRDGTRGPNSMDGAEHTRPADLPGPAVPLAALNFSTATRDGELRPSQQPPPISAPWR